tara:strand:+ start:5137 stop:5424 length:288 start_codon:yes stop_codon:yes gene_type:complete
MQNSNKYYIPKYIDEPARIVVFTVDEVLVMAFVMVIAFVLGHELMGLIFAAITYGIYTKFKKQESSAFLQRRLYWFLSVGSMRAIPRAFIKKYKG